MSLGQQPLFVVHIRVGFPDGKRRLKVTFSHQFPHVLLRLDYFSKSEEYLLVSELVLEIRVLILNGASGPGYL